MGGLPVFNSSLPLRHALAEEVLRVVLVRPAETARDLADGFVRPREPRLKFAEPRRRDHGKDRLAAHLSEPKVRKGPRHAQVGGSGRMPRATPCATLTLAKANPSRSCRRLSRQGATSRTTRTSGRRISLRRSAFCAGQSAVLFLRPGLRL